MKKAVIILTITIVPVLLISALSYVSMDSSPQNGFIRNIKQDVAVELRGKQFANTLTAISGVTKSTIYFSTMAPDGVFAISTDLDHERIINVNIRNDKKIKDAFAMKVDSPDVKIFAGNMPSVFYADLNNANSIHEHVFKTRILCDAVEYAYGRYIVREYSPEVRDFVLRKVDSAGREIAGEQNVSILKHDDGMSTQGTLSFSRQQNRIILVYKLFNSILCLDTNLNIVYKSHSIDTIQNPYLKTSMTKSEGKTKGTYASPPRFTNRACRTFKDNFYICSLVKADNEQPSTFKKNAVIDVYKLADGHYLYSFYLPHAEGKKMTDFTISDNGLIALYNHSFISFYKIKLQ